MRLLFDLDGTLTNSYTGISRSIFYALKELSYPIPEGKINWCIGPPLWESFSLLMKTDDKAILDLAVEKYRERFSTIGIFENEVYPGIDETLEKLQAAGHIMSVATSKPTIYAERIIEHFDLSAFFTEINGAAMNGDHGDKTGLIQKVIERENLAPEDVVMIGDRQYDMIGAQNNGVHRIGVLWGFGTREELESVGTNDFAESPGDLIALCDGFC